MWIIPKNLQLSNGQEYLTHEELPIACEQSLMHRGKTSKANTWLQRIKRGDLDYIKGRVLK